MDMSQDLADQICKRMLEATRLCNASLRAAMTNDSLGHANAYVKLVGNFMGYAFTNILGPLWRLYPQLEPDEMKAEAKSTPEELSATTRKAMEEFLCEGRAALDYVRSKVPSNESEQLFRYGGISEVEEALVAVENYLKAPYVKRAGEAGSNEV
jgi:hypothetical protein